MHVSLLDVYRPRHGMIHHLDPRVKIAIALAFILTSVTLPQGAWLEQGLLFSLLVFAAWRADLGPSFTIRRAFIALPFILAAVPLPFTTPGAALWEVPGLGWIMTINGVLRFLTIVVRTWIAVQASILLSATTRIGDLLWGFQGLRLPRVLVATIGFMVRYLFVLADEALRMLRARAARSPAIGGKKAPGIIWRGRMTGMMVGSLFLRSLERSERVHAAMLARLYDGEMRVLEQPMLSGLDWRVLTVAGTVLLVISWVGWR